MKLLKITTFVLLCGAAAAAQAQQYEWQPANDESVQLDPAEYHTGRVYRPGPDGGNLHVDIVAQQPITVEMARTEDWNVVLQHPHNTPNVQFRCVQEHVTRATFECHLAPNAPMTLILRDERNAEHAVFSGVAAVLSGRDPVQRLASPNSIHIQYYRWALLDTPPSYQWFRQVKEKYKLTPIVKVYGGYAPSGDGEQVSIKIKSPVPMAVALVPPQTADQLYSQSQNLDAVFAGAPCKQRGVQELTFQCTVNGTDGPLSLVVAPEPGIKVPGKKAEVEFYAYKCVANCPTNAMQ